jgi:hypothetical protein
VSTIKKKTTKSSAQKVTTAKSSARVVKKPSTLTTAEKDNLPDSSFAFANERKEPLIDAKHVRNAIARFMQVDGVSDAERDKAWRRIKTAAKKFEVEISESGWRELSNKSKPKKR